MKYLKTKLYIVVCIVMIISLLSISAVCNQCAKESSTTEKETTSEEAVTVLEEEKVSTTTSSTEETPSSTTEESPEATTIETTAAESTSEDLQAPTINLEIYEGPTYSADDGVCYYRIEAIVTGNPVPDVDFSKDDSGGAWGNKKCQVNLNDSSETYTLIAKATNSKGYATDSILLTWGCEEGLEEEEETILESPEESLELIVNKTIMHPINIGYIVDPSGINTETCIFGDSISNTSVMGFFGFDRMGVFSGREVESVSLKLVTYKFWGDVPTETWHDIGIFFPTTQKYFPLDSSDVDFEGGGVSYSRTSDSEPIEIADDSDLKDKVIETINNNDTLEFKIYYVWGPVNFDNNIDGREYRKQDITLTIEFTD